MGWVVDWIVWVGLACGLCWVRPAVGLIGLSWVSLEKIGLCELDLGWARPGLVTLVYFGFDCSGLVNVRLG